MKLLGAHVSIAGGVSRAPLNAEAIGAKAFAMFTKNQRQWSVPPLSEEEVELFKRNCRERGFPPEAILPHDGYLINLANPEREEWERSVAAFTEEMRRCQRLGLKSLNFHPGSHKGALSEEEALKRIAEGVNRALGETEGVVAVIENTAGQGSSLGYKFEHLARLLELFSDPSRGGVCLDTCHLFAAGYELRDEEGYRKTFEEFQRVVGFKSLRGMHLNDSKGEYGKRLDRHHSLGEGFLGWEPFRRLVNDPRVENIPLILETIDETKWEEEIRRLYGFLGN